jgi:hypothetical protein
VGSYPNSTNSVKTFFSSPPRCPSTASKAANDTPYAISSILHTESDATRFVLNLKPTSSPKNSLENPAITNRQKT